MPKDKSRLSRNRGQSYDFPKGILSPCKRHPFSVQKDTFQSLKGILLQLIECQHITRATKSVGNTRA